MKGFSSLDNSNHKGNTNTWLTPLEIVNAIDTFDLDPCAFPDHKTAKKLICLPTDGLKENWFGKVWLNPPYGKYTGLWLDKLHQHGNGVALVFSRTDTKWFQKHIKLADWCFFIEKRIKFLNENFEQSTNAGHGSCLLGYGFGLDIKLKGVKVVAELDKERDD